MIDLPNPNTRRYYSMAMMCSMDVMQRAYERAASPVEGYC